MLKDGIDGRDAGDRVYVMDIAEILQASLPSPSLAAGSKLPERDNTMSSAGATEERWVRSPA